MRRIENVNYYKMLEKGHKKKREGIIKRVI